MQVHNLVVIVSRSSSGVGNLQHVCQQCSAEEQSLVREGNREFGVGKTAC